MPQMAPLNWLTLFMYFSVLYMLINPLNFFLYLKPIKKMKTSSELKKLNWKW